MVNGLRYSLTAASGPLAGWIAVALEPDAARPRRSPSAGAQWSRERGLEVGDLSAGRTRAWDGTFWQPLWLVPGDVIRVVRECFDLPATSASLLPEGLLNQSWRIGAGEEAWVLRVSRPERSRGQVAYEHAVIRDVREEFEFVVVPHAGRNGATVQYQRGRLVSLFPHVHGVSGAATTPRVRGPLAAKALARLHRIGVRRPDRPQRPGFRSVHERPRWIWTAVRPVLAQALAGTTDLGDLLAILDREVAELDGWLDDLSTSRRPLTRGLVHGDFNPRNLLFDDDRLAAVLDWDECRMDLLAWEVAQVAFAADGMPPRAFWDAYLDAGGPLGTEDLDLLGGFARMGALSEVQWAVDYGRAAPHALAVLRDVAGGLARLRARANELGI